MNYRKDKRVISVMKLEMINEQIKVIRSRRRSISIEISPEGIVVRAPHRMKDTEIRTFLKQKEDWINKHQAKMLERQSVLEEYGPYTPEQIREFADKALQIIPDRVRHYAPLVGVDYGRITIRCQRTRWGSCSSKGNLNFNCLLVLLPEEIIDSVVVHELCHRKHMDHSAQFYNEVNRVFPEYGKCHKWLKENGGKYLIRLTR